MPSILLSPRKSLNKAYLKVKPSRIDIELFKKNLIGLLDGLDETESEEHNKNDLAFFLNNTFYHPKFYINTKDRTDLVIHNGIDSKSLPGVLIEAKKPSNKAEMIRVDNLNAKAFHELILYYLRERITNHNLEIKHLVATNIYEWYVFDADIFEKLFAQDKKLVQQFTDFEEGRLTGKSTDFFYKEIAEPLITGLTSELCFTWFNFRDYDKPLRNEDKKDDSKLIALYKLLSPEHLLKLPFANDSNSLDKAFYTELLHIIGLTESREGSKKLIGRKKEGQRDPGSLMENVIIQIDSLDIISRLEKPDRFGETSQKRLFNVSLELVITWIDRILFLKLLEAQLIRYHKGDPAYAFLNIDKLKGFDSLNSLFFRVLARKTTERDPAMSKLFSTVPYLNSSLFEPTELERETIFISNLQDDCMIPIHTGTVLKNNTGKRLTGSLNGLDYIFTFLEAYDFSGEGAEEIQEENKTLINASVLGLIFEKINGYKDGSFFTPGFITMYMCRETIRRAVLQKFKEAKGWECQDLNQLYNKIVDTGEANRIINELKICDPAVGSGHFLVSALNEIISIKSELKILSDKEGKRLKEYHLEVVNDELIITDEDGDLFEYNPSSPESQRLQETLFHEKQTIIENCLFGVDINPNSVKICRLRLWIELLKSAYYKEAQRHKGTEAQGDADNHSPVHHLTISPVELETLPNIDINIKCGNSLISRYALDADIKQALKKSRWSIDSYRMAVMTYRNARSKEQKREMERLIESIKTDFETEVAANDKRLLHLKKLNGELFNLTNQTSLFESSKKEFAEWTKKVNELTSKIKKLETELEEIKNSKIYENAFEWRFEFPEVLNDEGDFVGFDVVIGNPPYIRQEVIKDLKFYLQTNYSTYSGTADLYVYFVEKGFDLLKQVGNFCFIMPNKWMQTGYGKPLRSFFLQNQLQSIIDFGDLQVFDEATTYPCILNVAKQKPSETFYSVAVKTLQFDNGFATYVKSKTNRMSFSELTDETWVITDGSEQALLKKLNSNCNTLFGYLNGDAHYGIKAGLTKAFIIDDLTKERLIQEDGRSRELIMPFLLGRNIKPYSAIVPTNWLILIPKGFTIKRNLPESNPFHVGEPPPRYGTISYDDAWSWFNENYPAIAAHLLQFKTQAELRSDQGDFWWELRACDYYHQFYAPKIMYQVFQVKPCFIFDENGFFCNNSMWIIPKADKVLVAILNSKMGWWLISKYCTAIQNGYQLIWKYFGQIPIPQNNEDQANPIIKIVDQIHSSKKSNPIADTSSLEKEIDQLVYELYGLTKEEVKILEGIS
ncbi:MAG: Eco57I restriction-modification methylase domain-containing protein [Bacteroidetes bacterium]|nr:Eco57I restriction-modification methylase domain-containing protein [Bacteroidota bacterium]